MKIAILGTGYVGLVTAVCFSELGHSVIGVDVTASKIKVLNAGEPTIYEPGLSDLLKKNLAAGRIQFSTDVSAALEISDTVFITVGSPSDVDGITDITSVISAAETIAKYMTNYKLIVIKSTVPVGTLNQIRRKIEKILNLRNLELKFDLASNPEFLREGCAVNDFLTPDRVVIGTSSKVAIATLNEIYSPLIKNNVPFLIMDSNSAEMTKYAANCLLAARISLMNEFARICEDLGADIRFVQKGVGTDHRIGSHMLNPGLGYGGSCFPKDVRALGKMSLKNKKTLPLINAIADTNVIQREHFLGRILEHTPKLKNKKIAIWGTSFKPETDDVREAPAIFLIEKFLGLESIVSTYDPAANTNLSAHFGNKANLYFYDDMYQCAQNADILIIATDWSQFASADFMKLRTEMKNPVIFDGRNLFCPDEMEKLGFDYHSVGRGKS